MREKVSVPAVSVKFPLGVLRLRLKQPKLGRRMAGMVLVNVGGLYVSV
ncbi:MAG TPA: hypothetical protein VGD63_11155 [Steroidobacteraceae bacterium]